jgi:hypothetical protein
MISCPQQYMILPANLLLGRNYLICSQETTEHRGKHGTLITNKEIGSRKRPRQDPEAPVRQDLGTNGANLPGGRGAGARRSRSRTRGRLPPPRAPRPRASRAAGRRCRRRGRAPAAPPAWSPAPGSGPTRATLPPFGPDVVVRAGEKNGKGVRR